MIKLVPLKEYDEIMGAMLKDSIFKEVAQVNEFTGPNPFVLYYFIMEDKTPIGVFLLVGESTTSVSWHGGLYKEHRGKGAKTLPKILKQFPKGITYWTRVREGNIPCIKLLEKIGCEKFGELPKAAGEESMIFYRWK